MRFYFKHFLIFPLILMFCGGMALGACIGAKPVWGTGDDRADCVRKQQLKKAKNKLKLEKEEEELKEARRRLHGDKKKTGDSQNPVSGVIERASEAIGITNADKTMQYETPIWSILTGSMFYHWPGDKRIDKGAMPERPYLNDFSVEYSFNPKFAIGVNYNEWARVDSNSFDPIMGEKRDVTGDVLIFDPDVEKFKSQSVFIYLTVRAIPFSEEWFFIGQFGLGRTKVSVDYKNSESDSYTDGLSHFFAVGVERRFYGGNGASLMLRKISARHDTSDYLESAGMGDTQILFNIRWGLSTFGVI